LNVLLSDRSGKYRSLLEPQKKRLVHLGMNGLGRAIAKTDEISEISEARDVAIAMKPHVLR